MCQQETFKLSFRITPEARRLATGGSRIQANLWDWAKVQIMCLYSITPIQSSIDSSILKTTIQIYAFAMSVTKIKSLLSSRISNFEGQKIRQFQANLFIEPMYKATNYELRVYIDKYKSIVNYSFYIVSLLQSNTES